MFTFEFDPIAFRVPYLELDIRYYGLTFALGIYFSYYILSRLIKTVYAESNEKLNTNYNFTIEKKLTDKYIDKLLIFMLIGIIVGARAASLFFYEDTSVMSWYDIINLRAGGLASHGGVFGASMMVLIFHYLNGHILTVDEKPLTHFQLFDLLALSCFPLLSFIRIGNFINAEVLGTPTTVSWAVYFESLEHTLHNVLAPRHPVQIYESVLYLSVGSYFLYDWIYNKNKRGYGFYVSAIFFCDFFGRFLLEFVKADPRFYSLTTTQWLTIGLSTLSLLIILLQKYSTFKSKQRMV
ncbi:prolipoprotein diacylglyceryl transferase [Chlamydiia bacterium]|nr:prolipoprotein diacylglyceryl transferase [Chlamydiia bacterium]